jgi:hypothetical protein
MMSSGQPIEVFRDASQVVLKSDEKISVCKPLYGIIAILWAAKAPESKKERAIVDDSRWS